MVFFGDLEHEKYIIPMSGNWVVPTVGDEELKSTWVGYQIVYIRPRVSPLMRGDIEYKDCEVRVRLWAVGEQAEEFITSTIFWDSAYDIKRLFERHLGKLIEGGREIISQIYEQEGLNDVLCWVTDIRLMAYYKLDHKNEPLESVTFTGGPVIRVPELTVPVAS
jgi:hypothetical protein